MGGHTPGISTHTNASIASQEIPWRSHASIPFTQEIPSEASFCLNRNGAKRSGEKFFEGVGFDS